MQISPGRTARLVAILFAAATPSLGAQNRGIDVTYGRWLPDAGAWSYTATYYRPLFGPVDYGMGVTHVHDTDVAGERTLTGGELSVGFGRDGRGLYVVGGAGLGMRHSNRNFDAFWSAGAGYAVSLFGKLSVGVEARYRAEDRRIAGFWRLDPIDRRGLVLQARLAVGLAGTARPRRPAPGPAPTPIPRLPLATAATAGGTSAAVVRIRVAGTAIEAMGSPYRWGGTDANGFDCSGLIQYAYGEHGIVLPRHSRDQARTGERIPVDAGGLEPGDILGFALSGSAVSHVGLYVGDGEFIHSSSSGVRLSTLSEDDPDGAYWLDRWVSATRVVN